MMQLSFNEAPKHFNKKIRQPLKKGKEKGLKKNKEIIRQLRRYNLSDLGMVSMYLGIFCSIINSLKHIKTPVPLPQRQIYFHRYDTLVFLLF